MSLPLIYFCEKIGTISFLSFQPLVLHTVLSNRMVAVHLLSPINIESTLLQPMCSCIYIAQFLFSGLHGDLLSNFRVIFDQNLRTKLLSAFTAARHPPPSEKNSPLVA
ncbi:hypothetical protein CRM22_009137 [Opisthorchis felineus]|uniref:Uncharacterized protein n=1 Tax=Opisthorchis felineus TaxID=147828 RepID=A0A4S2LF56_OPIFE|nr:hypothetical protein CRM22_009137 [Opisthorchis felineus]